MLETLDYTIRIASTPTILYFDLYLYSACAVHYVYINILFRLARSEYSKLSTNTSLMSVTAVFQKL